MCKKFTILASVIHEIWLWALKFKLDHVTWPRPFHGWFVICRLGHAIFYPCTKFEMSTITSYENMKGNRQCRNCGSVEWLGVTQGHWQCHHSIQHIRLPNRHCQNRNYASIFYHFRVIASYLSKVTNVNLPRLHLVPPLGADPVLSFAEIFGIRKLESLCYCVALFAWTYI